ncbi:MAG: AAA family ATPase, partial [Selenomonadaceae bacterium]|nr:AAA family ATPase [Selenomonadaceae bacterium]
MQERKRPMPVGIEDFKKLIQREYYFVDKTRFIRDLLDLQTEITLITRPRRFGKTLTLSMLQYFFTLEDAEENRKLFAGLDIERAGTQYMREQGTRPVVFLTIKEVQAGKFSGMMA